MNVLVSLGTRPEIIRLYYTIKKLRPKHIFWTGQNFSKNLSTELIEDPRFGGIYNNMYMHDTKEEQEFSKQFASMLVACTEFMKKINPEKLLILGDTNSSLAAALAARKLSIPIYHMEAGNRCYDFNSPEETNRRMIDSISDVHLCYTKFAKQNLLSEGVAQNLIHVIGNPMSEFPEFFENNIEEKNQILVTIHRKENIDYLSNLKVFFKHLENIHVKLVLHPRYYDYFKTEKLEVIPSVNFSEFVRLQKESKVIITDSGTVCEEAAMLKKPCLVIRKTTERPELLELGSTILGDISNIKNLEESIDTLLKIDRNWEIPKEYAYQKVSNKVLTIVQGKINK